MDRVTCRGLRVMNEYASGSGSCAGAIGSAFLRLRFLMGLCRIADASRLTTIRLHPSQKWVDRPLTLY